MIELDDFIMLGTTVPEPTSSGRVFVCSAGYSPQLGQLMRVYPLARRHVPKRWHAHRVRLERPRSQEDSRVESWKLEGDRSVHVHDYINDRFCELGEVSRSRRYDMLHSLISPSIASLNERRASLGIITPVAARVECEMVKNHPDAPQMQLFYDDVPPERRFPLVPRLHFADTGGDHCLMLRDWGVFELMRKHGAEYLPEHLSRCLHLGPGSSFLVGNMSHQRNAWLVISVLNGLTTRQPELQLEFAT